MDSGMLFGRSGGGVMKREAERKRHSVNAETGPGLEAEASEAQRKRQLRKLRKELDRFCEFLPPLDASARLIREDRER